MLAAELKAFSKSQSQVGVFGLGEKVESVINADLEVDFLEPNVESAFLGQGKTPTRLIVRKRLLRFSLSRFSCF